MKLLTTNEFIEKATKVHGGKYDYSHVEYKNSRQKVEIVCPNHGSFWQTPTHHVFYELGCRFCSREVIADNFIARSKIIHKNKYDYSKVLYKTNSQDVDIICPQHGLFRQSPANHMKGQGCPICGRDRTRNTLENFIVKANAIHENKYDYSHVDYKNTDYEVQIICKIHGAFLQPPHSHIQGHGCPRCKGDITRKLQQKSITDFLVSAKKEHGEKYDYSQVNYENCEKKVKIVCKKHGVFLQTPSSHINHGDGCPKCYVSKGEEKIRMFLETNKMGYIYQKKFDDCRNPETNYHLKFDFFVPNKNVLIEYDGEQHFHSNPRFRKYILTKNDIRGTKYRDVVKSEFAKSHNIKLIRISYLEQRNINDILEKELL